MAIAENEIIIKGARLSFPVLFTAEEYEPGDGKPRYSAALLLPKDSPQIEAIKALGLKLFKEKFNKDGQKLFDNVWLETQKCFVTDGNKKTFDGYEGMYALACHRPEKSGPVLVVDRDAKTPLEEKDGKPYAGCYVNAKIQVWVQDNKQGKALRATLQTVQFSKDGDAFSASTPASTEGLEAEEEEEGSMV